MLRSDPTPGPAGRTPARALLPACARRRSRLGMPGDDAGWERRLDALQALPGRGRRTCVAAAAGLFAAIFALKLGGALGPADAPSVLCVAPIALAAAAFGLAGGVAAAAVATALLLGSELIDGDALRAHGMLVRAVVFLVSGVSLGLAVDRLRAWAEMMRALRRGLDELGEALLVLDEDAWTILHASPAAASIFGRTPEALQGTSAGDLMDPEDAARLGERRRLRAAGHRIPARTELVIRTPDGRPRSVESAVVPVRLRGRPLWAAVVRDVTDRRDAERRLADDHAFLRTVLDTAASPIAVLDRQGRVVMANRALERMAGLGSALLTGRTPWDLLLVDQADVAAVGEALRDAHGPDERVAPWRSAGGDERTIAWTAGAVRDDAGRLRHAVSVGVDITDQRAAEDRARRAQGALELTSRELERAHRDLGQVVTAATLDLREPLRVVADSIAAVEDRAGAGLGAAARDQLAQAGSGLRRLEAVLDALGDYGRLAPGEALSREVDVEATVDAVLRDLARDLDARGAEVTRDPLPVVAGDPEELHSLLGHLVANALARGGDGTPRIHVGATRRDLAWELCVSGNGPGAPAADRRRVLETFPQAGAPDAGDGLGVGLALCRRIAERHGGAIRVDEAPGGGSAFHVTLPDREAR
jgi:PAS domain S-box-containing protein